MNCLSVCLLVIHPSMHLFIRSSIHLLFFPIHLSFIPSSSSFCTFVLSIHFTTYLTINLLAHLFICSFILLLIYHLFLFLSVYFSFGYTHWSCHHSQFLVLRGSRFWLELRTQMSEKHLYFNLCVNIYFLVSWLNTQEQNGQIIQQTLIYKKLLKEISINFYSFTFLPAPTHLSNFLHGRTFKFYPLGFWFKMAEQKDIQSSPVKAPKSQLTVQQLSTGECWNLPQKDTPHPKTKKAASMKWQEVHNHDKIKSHN